MSLKLDILINLLLFATKFNLTWTKLRHFSAFTIFPKNEVVR